MKSILLGLALGLAATAAVAQDAPPPGCRWQGYQGDTILACKDGKGHWRRSGDDQIVGTYPMAKPKPKPVPVAAKPAAAPAGTASTAATGAPVVAELAPPAPPPPPDAAAIAAADAADAAAAGEASTANAPAAEPAKPAPAAKTPWWKGFLDRLWQSVLSLLKLIGLLH